MDRREELDLKLGLPSVGPIKPLVMFRKWKDYFPDSIADDEDEDDDEWEEEDYAPPHGIVVAHQMPGPFGNNHSPDVNKLFNFVVCTTNFDITTNMYHELNDNVAGIETLDKISHYKIRIGIGELFHEQDVKRNIELKLKECLKKQREML